jgi:hypothetical protein
LPGRGGRLPGRPIRGRPHHDDLLTWPGGQHGAIGAAIHQAGGEAGDVVTVAANVQAVPLPERYTLAARTPSTVAGPALGQGETAGNLAATET